MNATANVGRLKETSPRLKARIAGAFYLLTMLTGIFAEGFVSGRLVVDGDAVATATNIMTHRGLFQLGFAVYLIEMACNIAMTALFYDLLKPAAGASLWLPRSWASQVASLRLLAASSLSSPCSSWEARIS